jgi:hypothetical protein
MAVRLAFERLQSAGTTDPAGLAARLVPSPTVCTR